MQKTVQVRKALDELQLLIVKKHLKKTKEQLRFSLTIPIKNGKAKSQELLLGNKRDMKGTNVS